MRTLLRPCNKGWYLRCCDQTAGALRGKRQAGHCLSVGCQGPQGLRVLPGISEYNVVVDKDLISSPDVHTDDLALVGGGEHPVRREVVPGHPLHLAPRPRHPLLVLPSSAAVEHSAVGNIIIQVIFEN